MHLWVNFIHIFFLILFFLFFLSIPNTNIVPFEFFSIQLNTNVVWFLLYPSITSFFMWPLSLCSHCQIEICQHIFTNYSRFAYSLLIDLSLLIEDFFDFLKEHLSVFVFSLQEQSLFHFMSLHECLIGLLFHFCR